MVKSLLSIDFTNNAFQGGKDKRFLPKILPNRYQKHWVSLIITYKEYDTGKPDCYDLCFSGLIFVLGNGNGYHVGISTRAYEV